MKERPILFSSPMVRAILDGRKTMTRRAVKFNKNIPSDMMEDQAEFYCPYGQVGDRLWVRETTESYYMENILTGEPTNALCGRYMSDQEPVLDEHEFDFVWWYSRKVCPAIHMPRFASRITLEITNVRVERLQEIRSRDAVKEGFPLPKMPELSSEEKEIIRNCPSPGLALSAHPVMQVKITPPKEWFQSLWDSINGKTYPWASNPWVFVIEFKRLGATNGT